jgi:hypothetical protein
VGKKEEGEVSHGLGLKHAMKINEWKNSNVEKSLGRGRVQYNPNASCLVFCCSLMVAGAV